LERPSAAATCRATRPPGTTTSVFAARVSAPEGNRVSCKNAIPRQASFFRRPAYRLAR
jgi:hypothetical protein